MYSPDAVNACKTHMSVKMGVPAACCFAATSSALSLTHMHAETQTAIPTDKCEGLDELESKLAAQLL